MKNFNYKYTIRDFIDKNKWSNVYIGINNETGEKIILNILINVQGHEENLDQFKEEVNLLKEIDSENLVSLREVSTYINKDKTYYYIESEYFEGITLEELIRINKLGEKQCLQIIRDIIKGAKELNNKKINLGNLTTEDIIINGQGLLKINTLSLINNHKGHLDCKNYNLKKFDAHEDVYVIGSILCEMITGEKRFNLDGYKDLDKNIVEIIEKSTSKKYISKNKYKNLIEFFNDVESYLNEGEIKHKNLVNTVVNFEKIHRLKPSRKTKKYVAIAGTAIILLCTTVFGMQYLANRKSDNVATTNENINQSKENTNDKAQEITPVEENIIKGNNVIETNKEETNNKDEEKSDETISNEKHDNNDSNEGVNNNHNNNHDNSNNGSSDEQKPNEEDSDKENSDKEDSDGEDSKEEPDKDDTDEDKDNSEEQKPDKDNSEEEKPDKNPEQDKTEDSNNSQKLDIENK